VIDGVDAVNACYRFAGACGVQPTFTLRELWQMYVGRQVLIRHHVLWQASVLFNDKLDAAEFLRCGSLKAAAQAKLTMSDTLREAVEAEQGRLNRERQTAVAIIVDDAGQRDPASEMTCHACNGAGRMYRGRSLLRCRLCNGRGKVVK